MRNNRLIQSTTSASAPASRDEIAMKAYFSYLDRGGPLGPDVQRWFEVQAEAIAAVGVALKEGSETSQRIQWN
jgi:hypothetical protein